MKIYYSPEYSGQVYIKPNEGIVMMDTIVVNTIGLINLLELRLGLHYDEFADQERIAQYYKAMCKYMLNEPNNIMTKSFQTAGLSTAKAILSWRDELRLAGWNFKGEEISERLKVIIGIESYFKNDSKYDLAARIQIVTEEINQKKLKCNDFQIILPCDYNILKPFIKNLIDSLIKNGAKVSLLPQSNSNNHNLSKIRNAILNGESDKIKLKKNDDSFLIYRFPDERTAGEYLAAIGDEMAEVWISSNNKQMDNWLKLMGKPLTGSIMTKCAPQIIQLFVMGIGLFESPLNVNTLIEWLNMPIHPIEGSFRKKLANKIVEEGGYRNENCKAIIERYINGEYVYLDEKKQKLSNEEKELLKEKGIKKRKRLIEVFLPSITNEGNLVNVEKLKEFTYELATWARSQIHLFSSNITNKMQIEQLGSVVRMSEAFSILLDTIHSKEISYKIIDSWISTIYEQGQYTHTIAEAGSRNTIDSPGKIISIADRAIWLEFEGDDGRRLECSFLYPTEKELLINKGLIKSWKEENENKYNEQITLTPLKLTNTQLILVICERRGGEQTGKHPLLVRLESQVENLEVITRHPKFKKSELHEVEIIGNAGVKAELQFKYSDKIKWPDHLSPTSISSLVEHPLDFLMERLINIVPDGKAKMSDIKKTMGNVAHAIIEKIFSPREGKSFSTHDEIKMRLENDFDKTYVEVIESKGAILQLSENKLKEKLLYEQLKKCLNVLLNIIYENNLKVTGCEKYVKENMKLGLNSEEDSDLHGFIDMTLEDEKGHPIVFDFKWTSSRHYYQNLLVTNRSVQLELYRHLLSKERKYQVERVAYFLMPIARLYSKESFIGKHCSQLVAENSNEIVTQLRNAVKYRKEQIDAGIIETNGSYISLQYVKDTESMNLFPLIKDEEQGLKQENPFSNYVLFNK